MHICRRNKTSQLYIIVCIFQYVLIKISEDNWFADISFAI